MTQAGTTDQATEEVQSLIRNSPLSAELTDEQCATLASISRVSNLKANEFLQQEGETSDSLHVLVTGNLEVVRDDQGGSFVTLHVLKSGDLAGELSFIDGMPHSAGLRAMHDCQLYTIKRDAFEGLLAQDPDLVYKVMRAVLRTVHRILNRMNFQYTQMVDYITKQHGRF